MVWYSHLFKNFPQSVVIHTVKVFSLVNEEEVDVFLEFPCFLYDPANVADTVNNLFDCSAPRVTKMLALPPDGIEYPDLVHAWECAVSV